MRYYLCDDCVPVVVHGDPSGLDYYYAPDEAARRLAAIEAGVARLGFLLPDYDPETGDGIDEFSRAPCDCCGTELAGTRTRFSPAP